MNNDKIKVIDIAKELNVPGKALVNKLRSDKLDIKNVMSYVDNDTVEKIRANKEKYLVDIKNMEITNRPLTSKFPASQGQRPNPQNGGQRPAGQGNINNQQRPAGQGNINNQQRPAGQGNFNNNRPQGGYNNQQRPAGQGNFNNNRPQGGYNNQQRPAGQGNFNNNRPQGGYNNQQRPAGQGNFNNNRPQGGYNNQQRPAGQGNFNNQQRPAGQGNFNNNRPQGGYNNQQRPGGQGGFTRPQATGFNKPGTGMAANAPQNKPGMKKAYKPKSVPKRREVEFEFKKKVVVEKKIAEKIKFDGGVTVNELAKQTNIEASEIIKKLFLLGVMVTINSVLEKDAVEIICAEYDIELEEVVRIDQTDLTNFDQEDASESLEARPPVVTIMGHVDHGKTSLLDAIRKSKVAAGEKGGITQHIGAYQIEHDGKKITFIDTPGHEAFTAMRARGSQVTDIVIIVVSAEDSVMPQTIESIEHAKAAKVPMIVAVNKMDKPNANPERVMTDLAAHSVVPEEWGGDVIFTNVSALTGLGLDDLLENILLISEVEDYKANKDRLAYGRILEARLDKGRGVVATLLVQKGTLKVGDPIVVGSSYGRVRTIQNDLGKPIKEALPSTPVEVTGLDEVPSAGDIFAAFESEKQANKVGQLVKQKESEENRKRNSVVNVASLFNKIEENDMKQLPVIIKADVQGSLEALSNVLGKIEVEGVKVNIISSRTGAITESDIQLAKASNAIVVGFNVRPAAQIRKIADNEGVDIRLHSIIYNVASEIEEAMKGTLDPVFKETIIGSAKVVEIFKISKLGTIAGCMVEEGRIRNNSSVRIMRDGVVIYTGKINTLRRFQNEAKEVIVGQDCGLTVENFNDFKTDDIIELFEVEEVKA